MKASHVTLKDIAKELGISTTTVSRALKDYPDISNKTKKAVVELAERLKYRPNPIALNLRKNKSNIIGVIIPEIVHHFFSTIISGIMEVADEAGYTVMLCQTNETYRQEVREASVLLSSRVDGLLMSLSNETEDVRHIEEFQRVGIPVVLFDKVSDQVESTKVIVDDYEGAFHAVEHLIEQGCRKIALLRGPLMAYNTQKRFSGYLDALKKHQIQVEESLILECKSFSLQEGAELAQQLLRLPQMPDAIFGLADQVAIGALHALKAKHIKIPQEIAVVGFSDWEMASLIEPALSSVYQPGYEMGKTATKLLLNEILLGQQDQDPVLITKMLPTQLKVRSSSHRNAQEIQALDQAFT